MRLSIISFAILFGFAGFTGARAPGLIGSAGSAETTTVDAVISQPEEQAQPEPIVFPAITPVNDPAEEWLASVEDDLVWCAAVRVLVRENKSHQMFFNSWYVWESLNGEPKWANKELRAMLLQLNQQAGVDSGMLKVFLPMETATREKIREFREDYEDQILETTRLRRKVAMAVLMIRVEIPETTYQKRFPYL